MLCTADGFDWEDDPHSGSDADDDAGVLAMQSDIAAVMAMAVLVGLLPTDPNE